MAFPAMHLPAKSLQDLEIDEKLYKADFELSSRYDSMARELQRLALLGIGAYGFFIAKAGMDTSGDPTRTLLGFVKHPVFPVLGLLAFALATGCALFCSYLNSRCLKLQVDILRLFTRIESGRWTDAEQNINAEKLAEDRAMQKRMLQRARDLMLAAVVAVIVGAVSTVVSFVLALFLAHQGK
jgi:hypothetical protein